MVLGLFIASAFFSVTVYHRFVAEREIAAKERETALELKALKQQAATLEAQVARLKSDRGIETEIRDRFEVSKKGEQVVVLVGDEGASLEKDATSTAPIPEDVPQETHFWDGWW